MSENFFNSRIRRIFLDAGMAASNGKEAMLYTGFDGTRYGDSTNTDISVGFANSNLNVRGTRRIKASRIRLDTLFRNVTPTVYCYTPRTHQEVAQALIDRYGAPLQVDWFVQRDIDKALGDNPPFDIALALNRTVFTTDPPTSQYWLTVHVEQASMDVAELFKQTVLAAPQLPFTVRQGYKNTELMTYHIDFTPTTMEEYKLLLSITSSEYLWRSDSPYFESSENLIQLLKERLGIDVTTASDVEGSLCLRNATLVYNGLTTGISGVDAWYDRVLVFDTVTDPVDSTARTYRGRCYIHFNDLT